MSVVLVIGDVIRDEYIPVTYMGEANEGTSPVPVYRRRGGEMVVYGGVVNVADRIAAGGHEVVVASRAPDVIGEQLDVGYECVTTESVSIPIKKRYHAGDVVRMRVDVEEPPDRTGRVKIDLKRSVFDRRFDAMVVVDYGKMLNWCACMQPVIDRVKEGNPECLVLVDPKFPDWMHLKGVLCFTPNEAEFEHRILPEEGRVVETCGAKGIRVWDGSAGDPVYRRHAAFNTEPVDVCGAGEAFISQLCLSLLDRSSEWNALVQAQLAAAECVSHLGCAVPGESGSIADRGRRRGSC